MGAGFANGLLHLGTVVACRLAGVCLGECFGGCLQAPRDMASDPSSTTVLYTQWRLCQRTTTAEGRMYYYRLGAMNPRADSSLERCTYQGRREQAEVWPLPGGLAPDLGPDRRPFDLAREADRSCPAFSPNSPAAALQQSVLHLTSPFLRSTRQTPSRRRIQRDIHISAS